MKVFGRQEWKEFFLKLYNKVDTSDIFSRAAVIAFCFSFALFPLLLFLVTLAGMVLDSTNSLKRDMYGYLYQLMPSTAYDLVHKTLDEVIENSSGGKLTLGLFITLWSASAGVDALRSSMNAVYEVKETRSFLRIKGQSLVLTLLFIVLLAFGLIAVSTGLRMFDLMLAWVGLEVDSVLVLTGVQWLTIFLVLLFTTEVIYNWIPCHRKFHWYWATPGSATAIVLWLLLSGGFRIYLQYFNTYNKAYGSLGAVIILMLWLFLSGTAILVGASINSVLKEMEEDRLIKATDSESVQLG
ncbi:MAG TPA: YihY/virulence factor BrkB family protein [Pyrinomonadaceae bacterium]|nr:YihY/virulence factor BrkB family protein [Pyrinomonadaceae bacterium]HVQ56648.1 YihY/virulence factor BrkB family protein [Pyrinomonadaceae bacterium]